MRYVTAKQVLGDEETHKKRVSKRRVEELIQAADMIEIMEAEYGMLLEEQADGEFAAFCPLPQHVRDEAKRSYTPSLFINTEKRVYHCFACGAGGNILTFIQKMDGVSFGEAIQRLALITGLDADEELVETYRHLRDIEEMLGDYLSRKAETALPAGMSETEFLRRVAQRMRAYEARVDYDEEELAWVESVYRQLDDLTTESQHKRMAKIWSGLGKQMKERVAAWRARVGDEECEK